jgi:hypothetical protein
MVRGEAPPRVAILYSRCMLAFAGTGFLRARVASSPGRKSVVPCNRFGLVYAVSDGPNLMMGWREQLRLKCSCRSAMPRKRPLSLHALMVCLAGPLHLVMLLGALTSMNGAIIVFGHMTRADDFLLLFCLAQFWGGLSREPCLIVGRPNTDSWPTKVNRD